MPGITRYWTPFSGTTNEEIVHARAKYLQKPNCRVLDNLQPNSLAFMNSAETLLINGHGRLESLTISETRDGSGRYMDIPTLAAWLRYANLPKDHVRIKMLGCETQTFARFLACALKDTHPQIVVGGYKYSIYVGNGHRALVTTPQSYYATPNTTGSGNVVWYNAQGNPVPKPQAKIHELQYDPFLDV